MVGGGERDDDGGEEGWNDGAGGRDDAADWLRSAAPLIPVERHSTT